jgi:trk system potassium uptake protein TrkA
MTAKRQIAIIGLGLFGESVSRTLYDLGHEVLVVDTDDHSVRHALAVPICSQAVVADSTDPQALQELDIASFDGVIVAIGDLEASVLTLLNLIELGARGIVIKATHPRHGTALERIGGDQVKVVYPETQVGQRVGRMVGGVGLIEAIEIEPQVSIVEAPLPRRLVGQTIRQAGVSHQHGVVLLALKRGEAVVFAPNDDEVLLAGDVLALLGHKDNLAAFATR